MSARRALLLLLVAASAAAGLGRLVSVHVWKERSWRLRAPGPAPDERVQALHRALPLEAEVRYRSELPPGSEAWGKRYFSALYGLAPRVVAPDASPKWALDDLGDGPRLDALPAAARTEAPRARSALAPLGALAGLVAGLLLAVAVARRAVGAGALRGALAAALALALWSGQHGLAVVLGARRPRGLALLELALAALSAGAAAWLWRRGPALEGPAAPGEQARPARALAALAAAACALALLLFAEHALRWPDGGWDAIAIWNLRARFLLRGGLESGTALGARLPASHFDYPLLLPSLLAQAWALAGEARAVPVLAALAFALVLAVGLRAALLRLRGPGAAAAGLLALVSAPAFLTAAWSQYADVPLAAFVSLSAALLALRAEGHPDAPAWAAGLCAGAAAWTKNEGSLWLVALAAAAALAGAREGGPRLASAGRALLRFGAGALPFLLLLAAWKGLLAPPGDLVAAAREGVGSRLADPGRWLSLARGLGREVARFEAWALWPWALLAALALALRRPAALPPSARALGAALAVAAAGFAFVYLALSPDVEWHVGSSLTRLLLQAAPVLLLALAAALAPSPHPPAPTPPR